MNVQYIFFSGKGGVGKTTMACATAVHYAESGKKTLIITTDPASNLADVFEIKIGHKITPLGVKNLWGMEIDPDKATEEYRERILAPMRAVMPVSVMKVMEEQFNSPCTTEIASFDRFVDFMVMEQSENEIPYEVIIFDTAPTGHTIRLLELPVDWSKHIEDSAKGGGNTCIGPVASIQENKKKYDEATRLLGDPSRTDFVFVLQPEGTSLYETKRSKAELEGIGVQRVRFIINGILPQEVCTHPFFRSRYEMQQKYLEQIRQDFKESITYMYQRDGEIKGIESLRAVAVDLFSAGQASGSYRLYTSFETLPQGPLVQAASLFDLINPTPGKTKAIFFTGKGGVGKTTVSTAVAYGLGQKGYKTLLLTTDPASHIGQVLQRSVGSSVSRIEGADNLWATMIDQKQAAEEYKARIVAEAQKKYSPDMIAAVREELESPCTEEMAAFDKFMGYVESDEFDVVVFDTAPTGHTLRIIELPFDYDDQVGMMIATTAEAASVKSETQHRFEKIIARMKDPERSIFAFVVYPESTPVVEAYRAMLDLKDAGIETKFVVANQVLPSEVCTNEFFKKRRAMQVKYLAEIEKLFNKPITIMPLLDTEITGLPMVAEASELLLSERETESA